jgi:hypothetical protein
MLVAEIGKCVHSDTPILMIDANIKTAKEIVKGDQLMGPDSCPRIVESIYEGDGVMWKLTPEKGRSFVCNTSHVLTLRGRIPVIEYVGPGKNYVVYYTKKGVDTREAFTDYNDAFAFVARLGKDIFDLGLDQYQLLPKEVQDNCFLFHVGVNFANFECPIDPYWVGRLFGCPDNRNKKVQEHMAKFPNDYLAANDHVPSFAGILEHLVLGKIPRCYKINKRNIRLQFLKGYADAQNGVKPDGLALTEPCLQIAHDIEFIAFSLGLMVTMEEYDTSGDETSDEHTIHDLHITGPALVALPCLGSAKMKNFKDSAINPIAVCQRFTVQKMETGKYCGWTLDSDGRYLLGDFLATSSSGVSTTSSSGVSTTSSSGVSTTSSSGVSTTSSSGVSTTSSSGVSM